MTTQLEVLNHMLNTIGETPVSSPDSNHPSALSATVTLNRVNKEFQKKGWWFNTEYDLTLSPDINGHILIPTGTLYIDPIDVRSRLARRNGKLYDPVNHTYVIGEAVVVDAVLQLEIEDLPESAASYLMHKAAYDFYVNDDGDETKSNRLEKRVDKAWGELRQEELKAADINANNRPMTARLRIRMRQGGAGHNPTYPGGG